MNAQINSQPALTCCMLCVCACFAKHIMRVYNLPWQQGEQQREPAIEPTHTHQHTHTHAVMLGRCTSFMARTTRMTYRRVHKHTHPTCCRCRRCTSTRSCLCDVVFFCIKINVLLCQHKPSLAHSVAEVTLHDDKAY